MKLNFFKKRKPQEDEKPEQQWVIELFDPGDQEESNFADLMSSTPATLFGPYVDPILSLDLLDSSLGILNLNRPDTSLFRGRIRPIVDFEHEK